MQRVAFSQISASDRGSYTPGTENTRITSWLHQFNPNLHCGGKVSPLWQQCGALHCNPQTVICLTLDCLLNLKR
jgi:hypothetical protein